MKGYKTLVFAAAGGVTSFLATPELSQWVAENLEWAGAFLATAIVVLRAWTNSPMFSNVRSDAKLGERDMGDR
jgi:hypothetical protein